MSAIASAITGAIAAGFGIVGDFARAVQDTFAGIFLTTVGEGSSATTELSVVAIVGLVMIGVAIVTGLGMLIFRKLFNRA